jgi:hypothetical protein
MNHHWLPSEIILACIGGSGLLVVEIMIVMGIRDFIRWKSYGMAWLGVFLLLVVPALALGIILHGFGM